MALVVDIVYLVAAVMAAPFLAWRAWRRGRRVAWRDRLGAVDVRPSAGRRRIAMHAVSVGEVNAIRTLVRELERESSTGDEAVPDLVVSVTTETGFERARQLFGTRHAVVRQPLDLSWAVRRFLDRVRPDIFVSVELEVWPNLTAACARRGIPFVVVNGRLSERSARRYARIRPFVRPSFRRLGRALVQDETYAARFADLGTTETRIEVTGTMKWDAAELLPWEEAPDRATRRRNDAGRVPGAEALAASMGIDPDRPLVVAGSTAPEEHAMLHEAVPKGVQLLCAPRRPEWFDQAAADLPGCVRRSTGGSGSAAGRFLLDTIGELRAAYALADVVVVGRSFGNLYGSDMMEPVAMGKPVVVGPSTADFQSTVDALLADGGIVRTDASGLASTIARLLGDPAAADQVARRGLAVVASRQGASRRTADVLRRLLRDAGNGEDLP